MPKRLHFLGPRFHFVINIVSYFLRKKVELFCKYEANTDDVRQERRYNWIILQWSKNDFKSTNSTNGDYLHCVYASIYFGNSKIFQQKTLQAGNG